MIQDLDSTNGTLLDGARVTAPDAGAARHADQGRRDDASSCGGSGPWQWSSRARAPPSRTSARSAPTTRTPATRARTCSSSPTAWAATPAATSPPPSRSRASSGSTARTTRPRTAELALQRRDRRRGDRSSTETVLRASRAHRHGHDGQRARAWSATTPSSRTSATRASTCFRDGALTQITTDHTFVQRLVDSRPHHAGGGAVPPAALGAHARARRRRPRPRDRHLHHADPARRPLAALLRRPVRRRRRRAHREGARRSALAPRPHGRQPAQAGLDGGAPDNVTVVLVDVGGQHPIFSGTPDHRRLGRRTRSASTVPRRALRPHQLAAPATGRPRTSPRTSSRSRGVPRGAHRGGPPPRARRRRIGWIVGSSLVLALIAAAAAARLPVDPDALLRRRRRGHRRDLPGRPAEHRPDLAVDAVRRHRDPARPTLPTFSRATVEHTISAPLARRRRGDRRPTAAMPRRRRDELRPTHATPRPARPRPSPPTPR